MEVRVVDRRHVKAGYWRSSVLAVSRFSPNESKQRSIRSKNVVGELRQPLGDTVADAEKRARDRGTG